MEEKKYDFGLVGLGVMGRNFVLNIADHGYSVIGLDNDTEKAKALNKEGSEHDVHGTTELKEFVGKLKKPRKIMMLVPAGSPVDQVINELKPWLENGDVIIDGGNSHFIDTKKRYEALAKHNIDFMGIGISGGSEGARKGPEHHAWRR